MTECLYYSDGIISNKKTLTKLCLLFDKVSTFHLSPLYFLEPLQDRWQSQKDMPFFAKSPCERSLLTSERWLAYKEFIASNSELINANILNPILINQTPPDWINFESNEKKLMQNGSGIAIGLWGQSVGIVPQEKIYVDAPWYSLYRWQSISGGLHFALESRKIPISDDDSLSQLAIESVQKLASVEHLPTKEEIVANVAFKSISLVIPNFPELEAQEILEVREKLSEDLVYFKIEIEKIVSQIGEISYDGIESVVVQRIKPRFDDLTLKMKSMKGDLFRRISKMFLVGGTATSLLTHFVMLPMAAKIATSASFVGKILLDVHEYLSQRDLLTKGSENRGLVFLMKMEKFGK